MRPRAAILAVALLVGLPLYHAAGQAPDLTGTWILDTRPSDDVERKIDELVKKMTFGSGKARRSFSATNLPSPSRLTIAQTSTDVTITTDADGAITRPVDGAPSPWKRKDGTKVMVSNRWVAGALQRTFRTDDGERVNTFTLGSDATTLTMDVVVKGKSWFLPGPLVYKLVYRRATG
jgi:hypothetical protein